MIPIGKVPEVKVLIGILVARYLLCLWILGLTTGS